MLRVHKKNSRCSFYERWWRRRHLSSIIYHTTKTQLPYIYMLILKYMHMDGCVRSGEVFRQNSSTGSTIRRIWQSFAKKPGDPNDNPGKISNVGCFIPMEMHGSSHTHKNHILNCWCLFGANGLKLFICC